MSDGTSIEWSDATWNFLVGCTKVSAGCASCYAIRTVSRLATFPHNGDRYQGLTTKLPVLNWTGDVRVFPERLTLPLSWEQSRRIFVNSMSDLFHEDVPDEVIDQAFAVMAATQHHTYQILTKRPERMQRYVNGVLVNGKLRPGILGALVKATDGDLNGRGVDPFWMIQIAWKGWPWPLPNVWLGTSTEDQRAADERIPHLLQAPAAVRFLSCEPLLGPIELSDVTGRSDAVSQLGKKAMSGIDWVITGGESGPGARPMDPQWARGLRDQCATAGVAYFHKQNGGRTPKATGRLLDGVEHNEFPTVAAGVAS